MEDSGTLDMSLPRIPLPRIGTSHGGLGHFRYEYTWNPPSPGELQVLMEDLGTSNISLSRTTPPQELELLMGGLGHSGYKHTLNTPHGVGGQGAMLIR